MSTKVSISSHFEDDPDKPQFHLYRNLLGVNDVYHLELINVDFTCSSIECTNNIELEIPAALAEKLGLVKAKSSLGEKDG